MVAYSPSKHMIKPSKADTLESIPYHLPLSQLTFIHRYFISSLLYPTPRFCANSPTTRSVHPDVPPYLRNAPFDERNPPLHNCPKELYFTRNQTTRLCKSPEPPICKDTWLVCCVIRLIKQKQSHGHEKTTTMVVTTPPNPTLKYFWWRFNRIIILRRQVC